MRKKINLAISLLLIFIVAIGINSCSENAISNPNEPAESVGITFDDIQWVQAQPEFLEKFNTLNKKVVDGALITAAEGGTVGGYKTYHNSVSIPAGAVTEDTYVTVEVKSQSRKGIIYVEFLPSGSFNVPVEVTMSWAALNIDKDDVENLSIYYSQDGDAWFLIDSNLVVNWRDRTCTFEVDHFTRFGWGF